MEGRCLIITGGRIEETFAREYTRNHPHDFVIAADAGLRTLTALGIRPDEIVGDLDTVEPAIVEPFRRSGEARFDLHRPEKDETDTELALRDAEKAGYREVDVLGALGGRLDHELANIQLLALYARRGVRVWLYDRQNRIHVAKSGETFTRGRTWGKYVSFIPLSEKVEHLTLTGFKYPLADRDILMGSSLCVSNEVLDEQAVITFEAGTVLCVEAHD
jgi:thiamine pyrophosphokinase